MQNNTNIWLIGVICLIVGSLFAFAVFPRTVETTVPGPSVNVPGPTVYIDKNVTVIVEVPNADALLSQAQDDAWDELKDDDNFLTCSSTEYDEDEVEIGRITDWTYNWIDSDENVVTFTAKWKFDSSDDDDKCTDTRTVKVFYEDGEQPKVTWN